MIYPNYQQTSSIGESKDIFFDMHKKMNSSQSVRDYIKIAKRAATLSSSLSSLTANGFVEAVGVIIQRVKPRSTEEVQIYSNSMSVLTKDKEIMTRNSVDTASGAISRLASTFENLTDSKLPDLNPCINEITDAIHNIIEYQAIDTDKLFSNIIDKAKKDNFSDIEIENLIDFETKRMRLKIYSEFHQIESIINNLTTSWDGILKVFPKMEDPIGVFRKLKDSYSMTTQKATLADVKNASNYNSVTGFTFDDVDVDGTVSTDMVVKTVKTKNIYIHGPNSKFINQDIIIGSVGYEDKVGTKLNIANPKVIHETSESNCSRQEINLQNTKPMFIEGDASAMFYHMFDYPQTHLHICLKLRPYNPLLSYTLYLRMDIEPTDLAYDIIKPLTPDMFKPCEEICFPPNTFKKSGTVFVGLKPSLISSKLDDHYDFGVTTSACFSWNETIKDWVTNQCSSKKLNGSVICSCKSGTNIISAVSFNLQPNKIHFGTVFSRFDIKDQGIVFGALLSLYLIFVIVCFWARYMDKKGIFEWGVFPLVDNYAYETYFYLITVHTGLRKSAGTQSKVYFCLFGLDEETGVRKLSDGIKEGFPTGSVYHFVMACPRSLGELQCLKIWHDNSGKGNEAPWFLDRIEIVDIQTRKAYYFICEEWLAAEYTVETTIEATSVNELENLKNMFLSNTKQHLTDDHMWLSVFIRPENSPFSRVERTGCCLAFLLLAMITSAMFYTGAPDTNRQQPKVDFEIGPLRIGYQQLYYSFLSALITAVPMMIVVTIFRKARTKKDSCMCLCKNKVHEYEADKGDEEMTQSSDTMNNKTINNKKPFQCCQLPWMVKLEKQLKGLEKILLMRPGTEELQNSWPHPFRYIAWIIIAIAVVTSSFFVILYSMEWGKDITEQWLTTFFLAFLQSLFVMDPFKVIVVSVILALLVKKVKMRGLDELDLSFISQMNKEYGLKQSKSRQEQSDIWTIQTEPPSKSTLKRATLRRKIHIMIKNTLQECLIHCVYLLIVSSLCYSNRSNNAYLLYKVISDRLVTDTSTGFLKINSSVQYFNWTSNILTPWLFSDLKKDKSDHINSNNDLNAKVLNIYLMGAARIRQLQNCHLYDTEIKRKCVPGYGSGLEETSDFCLGWGPTPCSELEKLKSISSEAWEYKSAQDVWGLPIAGIFSLYGGGGYIVKLNVNLKFADRLLKELKKNLWIDHKTRAVFHEFTVYSPNINYFALVILLAEYTETGGIVPFFNIYPYTVHNPPGLLGTYVQLCQVTGIVLTLLGIMYVVFIFGKKKWTAFKEIWFLLDFSAVIVATCCVVMFLLRLSFTKSALNKLKENRREYINFYHIVFWDSSYTLCLAMLVAIGYFRLLKLASYSKKTMKVYSVLTKAVKIFPGYFFFVFLLLLGFIGMGFAFFGCTSYYFKDILTTAESLFTGLLGRSSFRDTNVPFSDHWTTILYFCLFVGIVVIFLTNYFLAVLLDLLTEKENRKMHEESSRISIVLWDSFLKLLGRKIDPIDRMKDFIEEDTSSSGEDDTNSTLDDAIIIKLEKNFYRLMDKLDVDNYKMSSAMEKKRRLH
ncbi:hypothetical protein Btru_002802 [Bulinus truncatus]|nr:hypothetical protein Btru_002802 [Bulinus truncatus]